MIGIMDRNGKWKTYLRYWFSGTYANLRGWFLLVGDFRGWFLPPSKTFAVGSLH